MHLHLALRRAFGATVEDLHPEVLGSFDALVVNPIRNVHEIDVLSMRLFYTTTVIRHCPPVDHQLYRAIDPAGSAHGSAVEHRELGLVSSINQGDTTRNRVVVPHHLVIVVIGEMLTMVFNPLSHCERVAIAPELSPLVMELLRTEPDDYFGTEGVVLHPFVDIRRDGSQPVVNFYHAFRVVAVVDQADCHRGSSIASVFEYFLSNITMILLELPFVEAVELLDDRALLDFALDQ